MSSHKTDHRLLEPACRLKPVETIHQNNWFSLKRRGDYYTIEYNSPQVVILPIVDSKSIIMVSVKRPIVNDNPLELPAGGAHKGEHPLQAAARELREETGVRIDDLRRFKLIPSISISPNRFPVLPWIYEINISQSEFDYRSCHDDEIVSVHCLSIDEIIEYIIGGNIYVSLPLAVISRYIIKQYKKMYHDRSNSRNK